MLFLFIYLFFWNKKNIEKIRGEKFAKCFKIVWKFWIVDYLRKNRKAEITVALEIFMRTEQ